MPATNQDFTATAGDDIEIEFDTDANLTGAAISWRLTGRGATITKTIGSGVTITDDTNGICTVTLAPADTAQLAGTYYHELQATVGGGVVTLATGVANIRQGIN